MKKKKKENEKTKRKMKKTKKKKKKTKEKGERSQFDPPYEYSPVLEFSLQNSVYSPQDSVYRIHSR